MFLVSESAQAFLASSAATLSDSSEACIDNKAGYYNKVTCPCLCFWKMNSIIKIDKVVTSTQFHLEIWRYLQS